MLPTKFEIFYLKEDRHLNRLHDWLFKGDLIYFSYIYTGEFTAWPLYKYEDHEASIKIIVRWPLTGSWSDRDLAWVGALTGAWLHASPKQRSQLQNIETIYPPSLVQRSQNLHKATQHSYRSLEHIFFFTLIWWADRNLYFKLVQGLWVMCKKKSNYQRPANLWKI